MACATSCTTQDHATYGECLRSKGLSTLAGETTKASGPTRPNDALTAKALDPQAALIDALSAAVDKAKAQRQDPACPACGSTGAARVAKDGVGHCINAFHDGQDWFPCAVHAPTADPRCDYCTTTMNNMIRATTNPADLKAGTR